MDKLIASVLEKERERQLNSVELIASENFVSPEVLAVTGSVLTNKYAEGYPGKRYYGGCQFVDEAETLAIERLKKLYGCAFANVQPHSGTSANLAVYAALLKPGDKVLAMALDAGGHLTHGHFVSQSGSLYSFHHYGVARETERIDMAEVERLALEFKPKLIVAGASNYSRAIDFAAFRKIADKVGALLMVDMAHIAGLVATGAHPSPLPHAHVVTSTSHKTLRGPRGAFVLCDDPELAKRIDKAVFPGTQGGPLMHVIAAKAVAFGDAASPAFKDYIDGVVANAKAMAERFVQMGGRVVAGGTDNHLFSLDVKKTYGISGREAEQLLDGVGITANKNSIPFDPLPPNVSSGLRIGTPAMTTRGFGREEFIAIAEAIDVVLRERSDDAKAAARAVVKSLLKNRPLHVVRGEANRQRP